MVIQNIRSVNRNYCSLLCDLERKKLQFDTLGLMETWHRHGEADVIPGYESFYNTSDLNKASGVAIMVRSCWKPMAFQPEFILNCTVMDLVAIKISNFKSNIDELVICVCYRSLAINIDAFLEYWKQFLENLNSQKITASVQGDFNINILDSKDEYIHCFKSITYDAGFRILTDTPTRKNMNSATALDLIITNVPKDTYTCIVDAGITDHMMVVSSIDMETSVEANVSNNQFLDFEKFISETQELDFSDLANVPDLDVAFSHLTDRINALILKNTSISTRKQRYDVPITPWMTRGLLKCLKTKDKLYKKCKKKPGNVDIKEKYVSYKKVLDKTISKVKRAHYKKILGKNKGDSGKTWSVINNLLQNKNASGKVIKSFTTEDGLTITEDKCKASYANEFFISLPSSQQIDVEMALKNLDRNQNTIFLYPIDELEMTNTIMILKNKSSKGVDGISNKILKRLPNLISILTILGNRIFSEGIFPVCLKKGIIKLKYKGGNFDDVKSYRPITIVSSISKLFEKLIFNRMWSFIKKNNMINPKQFGFCKGLSTEDAILHIIAKIESSLNNGGYALALSLDIAKAFDTVSHSLLLAKLEMMGFRGVCLHLLRSYLSNREVCSEINNVQSGFLQITKGVPQGSILGPLLFILFTNDIHRCEGDGEIVLYADDNFSMVTGDDFHCLKLQFEKWIKKIVHWYDINGLRLNKKKSKFIIFGKTRQLSQIPVVEKNIEVGGEIISAVQDLTYLGLKINCSLSWLPHILDKQKNLQKFLPTLYRLRKILDRNTLFLIVKVIMIPSLEYCIGVYGNTFMGFLRGLNLLLKKAVRIVAYYKPTKSVSQLMKEQDIWNIYQIYFLHMVGRLTRIVNGERNESKLQLKKESRSDAYSLRKIKGCLLENPYCSTVFEKHSFNARVISIVNYFYKNSINVLNPESLQRNVSNKELKDVIRKCDIVDALACLI